MRMTESKWMQMQCRVPEASNLHDTVDLGAASFSSDQTAPAGAHDDALQVA